MNIFGLVTVVLLQLIIANTAAEEGIIWSEGGCGGSKPYPRQCSELRINGYVMINGFPSKIVEISTSKDGMVKLVGKDIFLGKTYEHICPATNMIDVPTVVIEAYEVLDIDGDDYLELLFESGDTREDLRLPSGDLGMEIRKRLDNDEAPYVVVTCAIGETEVTEVITQDIFEAKYSKIENTQWTYGL